MVGNYTCLASTHSGTSADVGFEYKLTNECSVETTIKPVHKHKLTGDDVLLECFSSAESRVVWLKDGNHICHYSRFKQMVNNYLHIARLQETDSGIYRCEATSDTGCMRYQEINLSVQAVPPTASVRRRYKRVQEGDNVELHCDVTGSPRPTVRWIRHGGELPDKYRVHEGVLTLYNVDVNDRGRYICTATSSAGSAGDYVMLDVRSGPVTKPNSPDHIHSQVINVGDRVSMECIVTGTPPPTVTWSREDDPLPREAFQEDNILIIPSVKVEDAGLYTCLAVNEVGSVSSKYMLKVKVCGQAIYDETVSLSRRNSAASGEYPWHVIFKAKRFEGGREMAFAGGSLISQRWVLTTAQIIKQFQESFRREFDYLSVKMYFGTNKCDGTEGVVRKPLNSFVHPNFNKTAYLDSDIALIELDHPVEYSKTIRPICIETTRFNDEFFLKDPPHMSNGKVSGCGADWKGIFRSELKSLEIPYVNKTACEEMMEELRQNPRYRVDETIALTDNIFCAGNRVKRTGDTCMGDAGGAFVKYTGNRWVQIGIVSFGIGRCGRGLYGFYTNVGNFYDWIKTFTNVDLE